MNTQEIINFTAENYMNDNGSPELNYQDYLKIYRSWEVYSPSLDKIRNRLPLKDSVVKLVYKKIYSKMPFDREYILKKNEHTYKYIDYLLYPSINAERLVVLLSGYSQRKTYNRYSWFWDDTEKWDGSTAYLFLNDTENTWYCGHENQKINVYKEVIFLISNRYKLDNRKIYIVGGSMGGYAALRLGLELNLGGVISINPQTSLEAASLHKDPSWFQSINKCGENFIPVAEIIRRNEPTKIYLECGDYLADSFDLESISQAIVEKGGLFILNHHSSDKHVTSSPNKEQLDMLISFFSDDTISNLAAENNVLSS